MGLVRRKMNKLQYRIRKLHQEEAGLLKNVLYKAGVLLEGGDALFVGNANRFIRLNLAMPRATLKLGLERIRDAILNEKVK